MAEESFNQLYVGENNTVVITLQDFSAPHQLYVPEYGGQIYILIGVASATFVGTGAIGLLLSWAIILWNVRLASGKDTPWWAYTANRWALIAWNTATMPAIPRVWGCLYRPKVHVQMGDKSWAEFHPL